MKIKRLRVVLPARMSITAQADARLLAEAVSRAIQAVAVAGCSSPITVQVQGQGRPVKLISQSVFQETSRQALTLRKKD